MRRNAARRRLTERISPSKTEGGERTGSAGRTGAVRKTAQAVAAAAAGAAIRSSIESLSVFTSAKSHVDK